MSIAETIREEVTLRRLTPADVARGSGVPYATVNEFLRDVRDIGTERASRIAEFLELELLSVRLKEHDGCF